MTPDAGPVLPPDRVDGVSVVMATYRGARFVGEQLESIAAQTLLPRELVVGDDGSDDGTQQVVEQFAARAPFPVVLFQHDHLGVTGNFLRTAEAATSQLIAWSDQDDVWLPDKLERCVTALRAHDAVLVTHDARVTDEELVPSGRLLGHTRHAVHQRFEGPAWGCYHGMATVFRADLLDDVDEAPLPPSPLHDGRWHHDEVVHELARLGGRRVVLTDQLALYRQHADNTAGMAPRWDTAERITLLRSGFARRAATLDGVLAWVRSHPRLAADARVVDHVERSVREHALRSAAHGADRPEQRLAALARGVSGGSYRVRRRGGLGPSRVAVDLAAAVIGARGATAAARSLPRRTR